MSIDRGECHRGSTTCLLIEFAERAAGSPPINYTYSRSGTHLAFITGSVCATLDLWSGYGVLPAIGTGLSRRIILAGRAYVAGWERKGDMPTSER